MRFLLLTTLFAGLAGCNSSPTPDLGPVPIRIDLSNVAMHHQAQLQALQNAVAENEQDLAEQIARSLAARLEVEDLMEIEGNDGVRQVLTGFQRILIGRRILMDLDLRLETELVEGTGKVRLWLRGDSANVVPVTLRPGGAMLRIERLFAEPSGEMLYNMSQAFFEDLTTLHLVQGETFQRDLGLHPIQLGSHSIASRTTWTLDLTAGSVERDGTEYPAQETPIQMTDRVELAKDLPNVPLLPEELAAAVLDPTVGMAGVMERCVRIHPREYDIALDALAPLVSRATDSEVVGRLAPCLRWLSRGRAGGADPGALRRWMARRSDRERGARAASNGLDI